MYHVDVLWSDAHFSKKKKGFDSYLMTSEQMLNKFPPIILPAQNKTPHNYNQNKWEEHRFPSIMAFTDAYWLKSQCVSMYFTFGDQCAIKTSNYVDCILT